jgi:hypothetical protein
VVRGGEMMLTELAGRVEISIAYLSHMPLDDLFAAAVADDGAGTASSGDTTCRRPCCS